VVAVSSSLVLDERKTLPGRGAWVHPSDECVDAGIRRRAFVRALRVSGDLDTQTFMQTLTKRLNGYGNKVNGSK
jgi:predicted RNA-binding protein YlxR (DUF448 family)